MMENLTMGMEGPHRGISLSWALRTSPDTASNILKSVLTRAGLGRRDFIYIAGSVKPSFEHRGTCSQMPLPNCSQECLGCCGHCCPTAAAWRHRVSACWGKARETIGFLSSYIGWFSHTT